MDTTKQEIERHMLECSICLEKYDDNDRQPRILPCHHTFCLSCLKKSLADSKIVCGKCRASNKVYDIQNLPKDNTRRDLMDILKGQKACARTCTMCDEGHVAIAHCEKCEDHMCEECLKAHEKIMKKKLGHTVKMLSKSNVKNGGVGDSNEVKDGRTMRYCLNCDKIVEACREGHVVVSLNEGYTIRKKEINTIKDELKHKLNRNKSQVDEAKKRELNGYHFLKKTLCDQFQRFRDILEHREKRLLSHVEEKHVENERHLKKKLEELRKHELDVENVISLADQMCANANKTEFFDHFASSIDTLKRLRDIDVQPHFAQTLVFTEACTTDDFERIIEAIGCFKERPEIPDNHVTRAETSASGNDANSGTTESLQSLFYSVESQHSEQFMEVLKSLTLSGQPHAMTESGQPYDVTTSAQPHALTPSGQRNGMTASGQSYEMTASAPPLEGNTQHLSSIAYNSIHRGSDLKDCFKEKVIVDGIPKGKAELLTFPNARNAIQTRFETNGLVGDWQLNSNGTQLVVYADSVEKAEYCKHILDESVFVENISVRPESMILVHSDKWLEVTRRQNSKYPNQIAIKVDHDKRNVSVYSTSLSTIRDVRDAIIIFFRDHDVKIISLKLNENVVKLLLKQKETLKTLRTSWSQFCVDVVKHDDATIHVKGIGIGLARVTRGVHELAGRCMSALMSDDGNVDDDDDDGDDKRSNDGHFDDDDDPRLNVNGFGIGQVDVQLSLEGVKGELRSLSMIGDDRVVYVVNGDVTELPVEVIVNPANKTLRHNGGLAKALVRKGGSSIQEECRDYIIQNGDLQVGEVMCSEAGILGARLIAHTVGPKWTNGEKGEKASLQEAVYNSLIEVNKRMMASVAIPAIGAGAFGFPIQVAARCVAEAINNFFLAKPASCIREVYLVDISPDTVRYFTVELRNLFHERDHVVSCDQKPVEEQMMMQPVLPP